MTQGLLQLSLFGRDQMVRGHPTQFTEVIRADLELNRSAGGWLVRLSSDPATHRFQRLSDPWQRPTSGQNLSCFGASSLLDQRSRVNMALSAPGSPAVIGLTRLYCNQGEDFSSSMLPLKRLRHDPKSCSKTAGRSKRQYRSEASDRLNRCT